MQIDIVVKLVDIILNKDFVTQIRCVLPNDEFDPEDNYTSSHPQLCFFSRHIKNLKLGRRPTSPHTTQALP